VTTEQEARALADRITAYDDRFDPHGLNSDCDDGWYVVMNGPDGLSSDIRTWGDFEAVREVTLKSYLKVAFR
jgi:hypothetical protein